MTTRTAPKQFESPSIREEKLTAFQWSDFIPAIYYPAWRRFLSCFYNKTSSNPEKDAVLRDVLPLFHNSSIRVPFRFSTDTEVLQVSGLSRNFATISRLKHVLHSHTIRSFVGNSFHPKLISLAIGTPDHMFERGSKAKLNVSLVWLPRMMLDKVISPFDKPLKTTSRFRAEAPKLQLCQNLTDTSTIGT